MKKYVNESGELHREDGPAIIRSNGKVEYWLNGEEVTPLRKYPLRGRWRKTAKR